MRCPDCSKFVSLEMGDPELEGSLELSEGTVTCDVRIVRTCAECSQEMKEATLNMELDVSEHLTDHQGVGHELEIEEAGIDQIEEGGGRYAKSYFGASVSFVITCSCDPPKEAKTKKGKKVDAERWQYEGTIEDKVAASHMEELV